MTFPEKGYTYSINEGNYIRFPQGVKKYIKFCQEEDKATHRPYTSRYIGSLVADFHRNLLKGGIYLYPSTASHPSGKLRLLYECNPMAFLAEQAGGKASDGKTAFSICSRKRCISVARSSSAMMRWLRMWSALCVNIQTIISPDEYQAACLPQAVLPACPPRPRLVMPHASRACFNPLL